WQLCFESEPTQLTFPIFSGYCLSELVHVWLKGETSDAIGQPASATSAAAANGWGTIS
ncbi:hypothetical protein CRG98_020941, partial [Punica granatum]